MARPTGAHRLYTLLLHGTQPLVFMGANRLMHLPSVRKIARLLGTDSKTVNKWLIWLETMGYIWALQWTDNKHSVYLSVNRPPNV